ncbi:hypothetical protein ACWDBF_31310 [Streptomyces angustmyceticus]
MPPKGHIVKPIPPGTPPAKEDFARALRALRELIDDTLNGIAATIYSNSSNLSRWLSAEAVPKDADPVERLHALASDHASKRGLPVSTSLPELRALHQRARPSSRTASCSNCHVTGSTPSPVLPGAVAGSSPSSQEGVKATRLPGKPAYSHYGRSHRRASVRRFRATSDRLSASAAQNVAPVPLGKGDRRNAEKPEVVWTGLNEVQAYFTSGRDHDALALLQSAGFSMPVRDVPGAVEACRAVGLDHAAEAMLLRAGQRDLNAVLYLARVFNQDRRHTDAEVLLRAATRATTR